MLFETINQEFKAQGTKYQVLLNFRICCRELGGLRVTSFRACVRSFCSVIKYWMESSLRAASTPSSQGKVRGGDEAARRLDGEKNPGFCQTILLISTAKTLKDTFFVHNFPFW